MESPFLNPKLAQFRPVILALTGLAPPTAAVKLTVPVAVGANCSEAPSPVVNTR